MVNRELFIKCISKYCFSNMVRGKVYNKLNIRKVVRNYVESLIFHFDIVDLDKKRMRIFGDDKFFKFVEVCIIIYFILSN